jgi:hypothetical protein
MDTGFEQLTSLFFDFLTYQYLIAASVVVLLYDYILSFNDEFRYIWKARWNTGKWLYLAIRYNATIEISIMSAVSLAPGVRSQSL